MPTGAAVGCAIWNVGLTMRLGLMAVPAGRVHAPLAVRYT